MLEIFKVIDLFADIYGWSMQTTLGLTKHEAMMLIDCNKERQEDQKKQMPKTPKR